MQRANADSFLEDFSPLSEALVTAYLMNAGISRPGFHFTIGTEKCFKPLASQFFEGLGTLDYQGHEMKFGEWKHFAIFTLLLLVTLIPCLLLREKRNSFWKRRQYSSHVGLLHSI